MGNHYEQIERMIKVYSLLSAICLVFDLLATLVFLILAGKYWTEACVYLPQIFVVTIYFYTDIYIALQALFLRFRLPKD